MKKNLLWFKFGQSLIFTLLILFSAIPAVNAQDPRCQTGCTAGDANFSGYWLEVPEGTYEIGEPVSANLMGQLNINRANGICCLMSVIDIYLGGIPYSMNFITHLGNFTSSGTDTVLLSIITWPYGAEVVLENIYAQWVPGTGSPCPTCNYSDCSMYDTPSKCFYDAGPVVVPAPLVALIEWSADCVGDSLYSNVTYTNNSTGGYPLAVTWDLGPTDDYVIVQGDLDEDTVVVNYKSAGLKEAWLYIEDFELQKDTASVDTVEVISCCEPVLVTCPGDEYFDACSDSLEIVAAYTEWMTGFQYTGGCNATHNKEAIPDLPDNIACIGDTIIFEYIAWDRHTADTCTSTFAVAAAPDVLLTVPQNNTIQACTSQDYINTAFAAWLDMASRSEECNTQWSTNLADSIPPDACGDSVMVVWTVTSSCDADVKDSAYFKVEMAPEVMLWVPNDTIIDDCTTQSEIDAEFTAWLAKAGYTGGCNHDWSTYPADPAAPDACGDSVMVVWTVTSDCEAPVIDSAYFKVEMVPEVVLNVPPDTTISEWVTQDDINEAFNEWLSEFSHTGGCGTDFYISPGEPEAPDYCGGSVTVTLTVTSDCEDDVVKSATFTVTGDMITPTITCNDTSVCLRPNGFYILSEYDKTVLSGYVSDNITSLEELGITVTPDYFTCDQVGEDVPVIITVTDLCGNTSRCTTYVKVCDDIDPVITCIDEVTASAGKGASTAVVDFSVEATDNCEANITYSHEPGTEFPVGTTEVWAIATDKAGNADTCMFNVVVTLMTHTVADIIIESEDHETLEAAVVAADLVGTLNGPGPFTVFAPTDAAFAALPEGTLDALLADPTGQLTEILLYHVVAAEAMSADLEDGQRIETVLGKYLTVTITNEGVFIDNAKVTVADIEADNGVVHVIDAVLLPPQTVADVIIGSEDHETLEAALVAADLVGTLNGPGPFTVFAPTDAAFAALPEGTLDALLADPTGQLTEILLYHVVAAEAMSADLEDGQRIETVLGKYLTVTITNEGVFIDNAKVTVADIEADNGVVHVIDAVLLPPQTVADVIIGSEDHETLEAALVAADLVGTLNGPGPFTVFAPTDAAFAALPEGTLDALLADPSGQLTEILLYHVVAAEAMSADLSDGQIIKTVLGKYLTVTITSEGVFIDNAKVTVADIEASNGVVHVIDAVLLPPQDENPPVVDKPATDILVHANQETKMPVDSVFSDPDGDELIIEVSMADGSPVPDWIDLEGDSLVFNPVPADTGCVNVVLTATSMAGASVSDTFEVCVDYVNLVDISAGKFEVLLYPNPTPGEVNIDLKPSALRDIQLTVFDITGKPVLLRQYRPSDRIIFDMTGSATGMYFVRIDFDGHSVLKKLVVDKQ